MTPWREILSFVGNGTRKPIGAAMRLLAVAKRHPEALQAA
jgi:hypothetical protein